MTFFSLHHAGMRGRSGFTVAPLLWRLRRVLRTIHRGIVAAKMRRLRSELTFHASHRDTRFEQPPVPREKWDY